MCRAPLSYIVTQLSFHLLLLVSFLWQFWLFMQKPESLNPLVKYHSLTSGLGNNYTHPHKVRTDDSLGLNILALKGTPDNVSRFIYQLQSL